MEANLDRDTEMFGKMDPFAELSIGQAKYKTKTHNNGAKTPVWNEQIRMEVLDPSKVLKIQVFDEEDLKADDLVCEGAINLAALCVSGPLDKWFNL